MTDLIVTPDPGDARRGTIALGPRRWACVLGRTGVTDNKREGDGATPTGRFPLRRVLYRADRGPVPQSPLATATIAVDDGWCDAPDDPAYNRPVKLPYPASAESMSRSDRLYDVVVILGHNDNPVVPGAGSAIFLHIAPEDGGPTAGCIAVAPADMREILAALTPATALVVRPS